MPFYSYSALQQSLCNFTEMRIRTVITSVEIPAPAFPKISIKIIALTAEAAMLTRLLPIRSLKVRLRNGHRCIRQHRRASFPFGSALSFDLLTEVKAISEPEKNADRRRRIIIATKGHISIIIQYTPLHY